MTSTTTAASVPEVRDEPAVADGDEPCASVLTAIEASLASLADVLESSARSIRIGGLPGVETAQRLVETVSLVAKITQRAFRDLEAHGAAKPAGDLVPSTLEALGQLLRAADEARSSASERQALHAVCNRIRRLKLGSGEPLRALAGLAARCDQVEATRDLDAARALAEPLGIILGLLEKTPGAPQLGDAIKLARMLADLEDVEGLVLAACEHRLIEAPEPSAPRSGQREAPHASRHMATHVAPELTQEEDGPSSEPMSAAAGLAPELSSAMLTVWRGPGSQARRQVAGAQRSSPLDVVAPTHDIESTSGKPPPSPATEVTIVAASSDDANGRAAAARGSSPDEPAPIAAPEGDTTASAVPSADVAVRPASSETTSLSSTIAADEAPRAQAPEAPAPSSGERADPIPADLPWRMLASEDASLAYHAARALEHCHLPTTLPSSVARALALGLAVRSTHGPLAEDMRDAVSDLAPLVDRLDAPGTEREALTMLMVAALAAPALLSHGTEAAGVLADLQLRDATASLRPLRDAIVDFGRLGLELTPALLKGVQAEAGWRLDFKAVCDECGAWLERSRSTTLLYQPATKLWQRLSRPDGELGRLFELAASGAVDQVSTVELGLAAFAPSVLDDLLHRTDRAERGKFAALNEIHGKALNALRQHTGDAVAILRRWCELARRQPQAREYAHQQAAKARAVILRELDAVAPSSGGTAMSAASASSIARRVVEHSIEALRGLFDPEQREGLEPTSEQALHRGLLHVTGIPLDSDGHPREGSERGLLDALLSLGESPELDLRKALEKQHAARNHDATRRIIDLLASSGGADVEQLARRREQAVPACRNALRRRIEDVRGRVTEAVGHGLVPDSEYQALSATVDGIKPEAVEDFAAADRELDRVLDTLEGSRVRRIDEVRERLGREDLAERNPAAARRIGQLLARGEAVEANECIDLALAGQALPESSRESRFQAFFPDFVARWSEAGSEWGSLAEVADRLKKGVATGPLDPSGRDGVLLASGARLLELWAALRRRRPTEVEGGARLIEELLRLVGFSARQVELRHGPSTRSWAGDLDADPIADRRTCPVPRYGSQAAGKYRLLCIWDGGQEDVVDLAAKVGGNMPVIALHLGRLNVARRRDLARSARDRRQQHVVVMDEALVAFLALEERRMQALFACTLPFTTLDPYMTTAGNVAAEMFFGRDRELQSVIEPTGTNLVYGGRQLGKTALLRHAVRRFHDPSVGRVVVWIDLKQFLIGIHKATGDIWPTIRDALRDHIDTLRHGSADAKRLREKVTEWLGARPERQIVVLLDESDAFLAADRRDQWLVMETLKSWMDATDRRFKVVFAGLHDVQRTSRDVNTPLAHLGTPICIGPLLGSGEHRSALDLIEKPLGALGYRFETPQLALRILSHTNYYPSLIQIFCRSLLEHLVSHVTFDFSSAPPYVITAAHVDETYRREQVRKAILDRFKWTLDLDARYRVLALMIADETARLRDSSGHADAGFEVAWIREQALDLWPAGFADDVSIDSFQTILDEMIGLGLLRAVGYGRYALRNTNVLNLFGTSRQITDDLFDALEKPPQVRLAYEPSVFRRAHRNGRSVLTAHQESQILSRENGVHVLFGTAWSGLDDVVEHLRLAAGDRRIDVVDKLENVRQLAPRLDRSWSSHREGTLVVVVPPLAWAAETVTDAADYAARRQAGGKNIRILFLGGPEDAWSWAIRERPHRPTPIGLRPWPREHLQQWLDEDPFRNHLPVDAANGLTGAWSGGMLHLRALLGDDPSTWGKRAQELREDASWWRAARHRAGLAPEASSVVRAMAELGEPVTEDDLAVVLEGRSRREIRHILEWGDLLGIIQPSGQGTWRLEPFIERLVMHPLAS